MGRGENNACPDFSSADLSAQLVARWKPEVQGMGMWGLRGIAKRFELLESPQ